MIAKASIHVRRFHNHKISYQFEFPLSNIEEILGRFRLICIEYTSTEISGLCLYQNDERQFGIY